MNPIIDKKMIVREMEFKLWESDIESTGKNSKI
jgi:hypothetical protein